jgi:DNA mismatch endonuclease, patch repair protein
MAEEDQKTRSAIMRAVSSTDTAPELAVRTLIHSLGFRYRLHDKRLPGKPDIVFSSRKKAIFVHGCFWHGHHCKRGNRTPKTNSEYWTRKIARNMTRDENNAKLLLEMGWISLVIWECELKDKERLVKRLMGFLSPCS